MSQNWPKSAGPNFVPAYQVSGVPYVTSSLSSDLTTTPVQIDFPYATRFFIVDNIADSIALANLIAAEHVSILSEKVVNNYKSIINAGGIFLGDDSAEVFGDYIAGPSHVMPTGGSARFNSALNVRHFLKYQPFINLSKKLLGDKLGSSNIPIAYVGDTIADINTVINARKEIPSQKFISIGIAPPHLHLNSRLKERNSYETNLRNAGADLILNSIYDLKDINLDLF